MALKTGERGGDYLTGGTHEAKFLGFGDGTRTATWGAEQVDIKFKEVRGKRTTTWSVDWPAGLVAAYTMMGGKRPRADFDGLTCGRITSIMAQELEGWTGIVRVGKGGYAHGLALPIGDYAGDFMGFAMREDGKPRIGYRKADSSYAHRTLFILKVIEGDFEGLTTTVNIPIKVGWDPDTKDMEIDNRSALYKVMRKLGIDWNDIAAQIERAGGDPQNYFDDPENPLAELEALAFIARDAGRHVYFSVKEGGYVDHQEMAGRSGKPYDHGAQQYGGASDAYAMLVSAMNAVAARLWGFEKSAIEGGKLTASGLVLAKQAIRPIVQAEEWDVSLKWGKVQLWRNAYLKELVVFFEALADEDVMTETVLRLMFGDSDEGREMVLDFFDRLPSESEQAEVDPYEQDDIPF